MGIFRFESNGVKRPQANAAKVIHFDGSPHSTLQREYGLRNIELRNERPYRNETRFDVYGQRVDTVDGQGNQVLSKPYKVGELFHHPADYPGGPAKRMPVSHD